MNGNELSFGNKIFNIKDIKDVTWTGRITIQKKGLKTPDLQNKEGVIINLNNGETILIFHNYYLNSHEII